jgi:predicted TIM-barrel fold metal-dependent hydrolase
MLIIDAHPHIYSEDEQTYPTIENPYRPPEGTGTVEHLKREMAACGVAKAVAIQTSTFYRWDNRFVRDTVKAELGADGADAKRPTPTWLTGVCTLDPDNVHSPDVFAHFIERCGIRGMRSIPAADGRLDHPGVEALWRTARDYGVVINALVRVQLADQLAALLQRFPDLNVVLDHCMNPNFKTPDWQETVRIVRALARFKNLHAKLTFMPTDSAEEFPFADTHEACGEIIEAFTPDRCVWGSDFPCELWCPRCTYAQHLALFTDELGLTPAEQEAILGGTAERLWF